MNLALSDEQELLREAARGTLARHKTIEAAHDALQDVSARPDLWPTAVQAGWPGLLVAERHGGAELGAFDAMLVAEECGRVLAPVALLGLLPATALLNAAGHESLTAVAAGDLRPVYVPARPPSDLQPRWTAEPVAGAGRAVAPRARLDGDAVVLDGAVAFVPDLPGADQLLVVAVTDAGKPVAALVDPGAQGVSVESLWRYDPTRPLGHVRLEGATGTRLDVPAQALADAWYLAHALIAAESIGAVQTCLDVSVEYAKQRHTFGRPIGSYQSIKHELTEVLRRLENARGLAVLRGLGPRVSTGGVRAGRECGPVGRRRGAGLRRPFDDQYPRRHRRHLGARRAAVLPTSGVVAQVARWYPRRDRPGRVRDAQDGCRGELIGSLRCPHGRWVRGRHRCFRGLAGWGSPSRARHACSRP